MSVIIIDGPEKAGKTTTIAALKKALSKNFSVEIVKWGPVKPDDRVYSDLLKEHSATIHHVAIWDRGWPSEYVYGKLLGRKDHRMSEDPWLGAWLHDRAVQANGLRVMMLGPSIEKLSKLRDNSDLEVSPEKEVELYREYAMRFGWKILEGYKHSKTDLQSNVLSIIQDLNAIYASIQNQPVPPNWAGPQDAEVVVVGNTLSDKPVPGGWLPFTSRMTTMFARSLGDKAIKLAWTNVRDCNPAYLRDRKVIISCGNVSHLWIRNYVANKETNQKILYIPHPSYLFRFKNEKTDHEIRRTFSQIKDAINL